MPTGKVKWFSDDKGFGFIVPDDEDDQQELFVHHSDIVAEGFRTLPDDARVIYERSDTDKGPRALEVKIAG